MNTSSPSSTDLPDILDIYIPEPSPNYLAGALWIALGLTLVIVVAWLLIYFIRKDRLRRAQPKRPRTVALALISRLERDADSLTPNAFGLRLSDIIKDFLHAEYGDRFRFETAEEFLLRIDDTDAVGLPPVTKQALNGFVGLCEELKFGRPGDAAQRCQALLEETRRIVNDRPSAAAASTKSQPKVNLSPDNHASTPPAAR